MHIRLLINRPQDNTFIHSLYNNLKAMQLFIDKQPQNNASVQYSITNH